MKLSLGFLRNIQTSSYPQSFQALSQQIRLYFLSKLLISIIIVLERLFVQLRDDNSDTTAYFLLIIADFLCSLILEWLLFGLMTRWKIVDIVQEVVICILHVVTYEFLIECSLAMFIPTDEQIQVLKHDILFLTTLAFIFIESTIFRTLTFVYIIAIFFHRLSPISEAVYYASWAVMTAIVLLVSLRFTQQKWICEKGSIPDKLKNDFETCLHGLALVTTQGNILYMNGNFKGILNSTDDLEALEEVLRLRKFESYPERARRGFMDEIRNEKAATPHMLTFKSKMSVRTKDFARQQSIGTRFKKSMDAEKASGVTFKPSVDVKEEPKRESYDRASYHLFPNNDNGQTAATVTGMTGKKARAPAYLLPKSANEKNETEQEFIHEENVKAAIEALFTDLQDNTRLKATWEWHEPGKRWLNALNAMEGSPKKNPQEAAYVQRVTMTPTMVQKIKVIYRTPINSELKLLEVKLYPFKNSQEEGVFMSLNDITMETRAQDAVDLSEQKDRLLRFVSHEFRQPLSSCLSLLEMLKGNISYNLVTSFLEPAINSNKILLSQVNDLLDFAQIKAKRLRIAVQPCNLKRVIEEVFGMMKLGATTRDITLKLDWDSSILRNFCTDPLRVKQILLNLISNAYKFTPPEGSVTVKLTNADNSMGRVVRVEVIDTGAGMTEEQQKGLFGEFKQVMQTFHINPRGVGLGLIISKLLSQQLGTGTSDLRVESEKGKGTTFSFLLLSKPEEVTKHGFIKTTEDLEVSDDMSRDKPDKLLQKMEYYGKVVNATQPTLRALSSKVNVTEASPKEEMTKLKAFELKMNMQRLENNRRAGLGSMKSNTVFSNTSIMVDPIRLSAYSQGSHGPNGPLGHSITQVKGPRRQAGRSQSKRAHTIGRSHTSIGGGEGGNEVDLMSFEFANLVENLNFRCSCQKVLLVDDDAFNLTAVSILLKSMGLETTKAVDGERAIQEVIKNEGHNSECKNFSIIFMDVEMPAFNGFETTKVLRRKMLEGEISFIPIIGVTGHNPKEKRVECLISGMNDIVMKPLAPRLVQSLVLKWVTEVEFEY